ncbi:MAG: SgcJ/EcaC family oxidoreductase [Gemmatimonadales bacterium]|jgi:uncharacterized protein (TIGR02246 family)
MKLTKIALILAFVPCLGLIACAQQAEQEAIDMEALAAAMAAIEADWKQAYDAGDAAAVAALYAEDAVYMAPYSEAARGRPAIEARLAEVMGATSERKVTIERFDAGAAGDLSYGIGTYTLEMGMAGVEQPMTDSGKYMTIAKLGADGTWKIYAHIWNTSQPEADVMRRLSSMAAMGEM